MASAVPSDEPTSPFVRGKGRIRLSIPPRFMGQAGPFVEGILASNLLRYRDDLGGVLVSWSGMQLEDGDSAAIIDEQSNLHTAVIFDGVFFAPSLGAAIVGVVQVVSSSHIGLLIAGTFNASVAEAGLAGALVFDESSNDWHLADDTAQRVSVGTALLVRVERVTAPKGVASIEASFIRILGADHPAAVAAKKHHLLLTDAADASTSAGVTNSLWQQSQQPARRASTGSSTDAAAAELAAAATGAPATAAVASTATGRASKRARDDSTSQLPQQPTEASAEGAVSSTPDDAGAVATDSIVQSPKPKKPKKPKSSHKGD